MATLWPLEKLIATFILLSAFVVAAAEPPVTIVMLVRDKAHALPYTLGAIERLEYNASQLSVAFYLDHSSDESEAILQIWLRANMHRYRSVEIKANAFPRSYPGETIRLEWTTDRILNVLRLRQLGLELAQFHGSEFAFFLDADALITEPTTLRHLVSQNRSLIAPLLNCTTDSAHGANFWGGIDSDGHYERSSNYLDIKTRRQVGTFPVSLVHTAFLLSLASGTAGNLRFYPIPSDYPDNWPLDDLPVTHAAATAAGIQAELDNRMHFGAYPTIDGGLFADYLHRATDLEAGAFKHSLLEYHYHQNGQAELQPSPSLTAFAFPLGGPRRLGFDRVYVISLERRPDRLDRMRYGLGLLGIEWQHFSAIDGRVLNASRLRSEGVAPLPGYSDPYHGRALTSGEVGCFLSHHAIWQEIAEAASGPAGRALVLEDDVRFGHTFEARLALALDEADRLRPEWELLYLGRKIMQLEEERLLPGARFLAEPSYTYWTLGYALTQAGARKLIGQKPLGKMLAVDEYLPIMFDKHPNAQWKSNFQPRNLVALSTAPLLLEPNYFIGMQHYVSDTEKSDIIADSGTCSAEGKGCTAAGGN